MKPNTRFFVNCYLIKNPVLYRDSPPQENTEIQKFNSKTAVEKTR